MANLAFMNFREIPIGIVFRPRTSGKIIDREDVVVAYGKWGLETRNLAEDEKGRKFLKGGGSAGVEHVGEIVDKLDEDTLENLRVDEQERFEDLKEKRLKEEGY